MRNKVIMVLDDDAGVARLCERVLKRAGYEVIAVTNPQQGAKVLQQARVDLLLVDIRMPRVDGFQVMEIARTHQPDLAIVVMTGFGTVETAIQALRLGANGLILKPFEDKEELLRSVEQALNENEHKREMARLQVLRPLIQITQSLFVETRAEKLIDLILHTICTHLHCQHAGVYRRSSEDRILRLVASRGAPPPGEVSDFGGGPIARADAWWAPVQVNLDGPDDSNMRGVLEDHDFSSLMCAPVHRNSQDRSLVLAARSRGDPVFSDADMEMFTMLARQINVALENARLYSDLRASLRQVEESQRALIQAEKMAAIGRLTAGIAHEVNNPLQSVRNCLHLAGREDLDGDKKAHYLSLAQDELERLMKTIRDMLDFYRPGTPSRVLTDINSVVESVLSLLEQQLKKQKISVSSHFSPEMSKIFIARNQIQQVFFNIILNAMEAMPGGGQIAIETGVTRDGVEVLLQDSGPGIPEDVKASIFEPFNSTKKQGIGLGLSVSYGIVDAHGGKIELFNGKNQDRAAGACFRITLPAVEVTEL